MRWYLGCGPKSTLKTKGGRSCAFWQSWLNPVKKSRIEQVTCLATRLVICVGFTVPPNITHQLFSTLAFPSQRNYRSGTSPMLPARGGFQSTSSVRHLLPICPFCPLSTCRHYNPNSTPFLLTITESTRPGLPTYSASSIILHEAAFLGPRSNRLPTPPGLFKSACSAGPGFPLRRGRGLVCI